MQSLTFTGIRGEDFKVTFGGGDAPQPTTVSNCKHFSLYIVMFNIHQIFIEHLQYLYKSVLRLETVGTETGQCSDSQKLMTHKGRK